MAGECGSWKFSSKLNSKLEELAMIPGNCPENSEWTLLFSYPHSSTTSHKEGDSLTQYAGDDDDVKMTQLSQQQQMTQDPQLTKDNVDIEMIDVLETGSTVSPEWLSSLTDRQAELVFSQLTDQVAEHIITAVCTTGHSMLASLLCSKFLLPYISRNPNISDAILGDLQRFAASFSGITCRSLLVPLMTGPQIDTMSLQAVVKSFSPDLMSTFLTCFLEQMAGGGRLEEWQLPVLCQVSCVFSNSVFTRRLVRLLTSSRATLSASTVFGQLVTEVATSLEADTSPAIVAELVETTESLETIYKNLAMFAITDTFSMSQE